MQDIPEPRRAVVSLRRRESRSIRAEPDGDPTRTDAMTHVATSPTPPSREPLAPPSPDPGGDPQREPRREPFHDPGPPVRKINLPPDSPSPGVSIPDTPAPDSPIIR